MSKGKSSRRGSPGAFGSQCGTKTAYGTEAAALYSAKIRQQRGPAPDLYAYQCRYGDHWHLTSKPQTGWSERKMKTNGGADGG